MNVTSKLIRIASFSQDSARLLFPLLCKGGISPKAIGDGGFPRPDSFYREWLGMNIAANEPQMRIYDRSLRLRTDRQSERIPRVSVYGIHTLFIRGSSRRHGRYFAQGGDYQNRYVIENSLCKVSMMFLGGIESLNGIRNSQD
jgi:hypothetical protein